MQEISANELADWLARQEGTSVQPVLLDVREPWEYETCHIAGALLVPMHEIPQRWQELDQNRPIVCICHHGMRSRRVADFLMQQGIADVSNLSGGIHAWATQIDTGMPLY